MPSTSLARTTVIPSGSHDVVLIPDVAAVRIARSAPAVESLPRRTALLEALAQAELPFATPIPLSPVVSTSDWTAVAVSWIPGSYAPRGNGDPTTLRNVLDALAAVDLAPLIDLLDVPHAYAGRQRWEELILAEAVPRLPPRLHDSAVRRTAAVLALDPVPPRLVHGDLTGENMHWSPEGDVIGVLDWDLAHAFDPAIDVACLAHWHGWPTIAKTVDEATYTRARTWYGTFALEQIVKYLLDDSDAAAIDDCVGRVVRWMDSDGLADDSRSPPGRDESRGHALVQR
ncbi:aminoglycoside phosphotransferase family protein [Pseudonocardia alaniniphila]|uniref:Aminoglycoside phosphotransferase family protein n=1 Tax=Pseudonocardia alaniniphila TaxID=75291 RepID=A0ABS9TNC9_9PSEU|nr:aminoglycoside phosphotransferase family protein [Pseudonocardia alaniniphila]MCH6169776.1 aminoglycoside phosphotransferase family protein [Pseudonocardia alaniniphila]